MPVSEYDKKMSFNIHRPHKKNTRLRDESHKKKRSMPKYTFNTLRRHTFDTYKIQAHYMSYSLWEPFTPTLCVVSE